MDFGEGLALTLPTESVQVTLDSLLGNAEVATAFLYPSEQKSN